MFKIVPNGKNRLDIKMSGKLNTADMKVALDELITKAQDIEHGTMLYDVVDYHLPSLGAIGEELSRFPELLSLMRKFERAAVLTDKLWIEKVSELEGYLIPGLEIKGFKREQRAEAERWLER
jgi:hypothetical protein